MKDLSNQISVGDIVKFERHSDAGIVRAVLDNGTRIHMENGRTHRMMSVIVSELTEFVLWE